MPDDSSSDDDPTPPVESALAAAVDDALADEVKRQKARFLQQIMGLDRIDGVGRLEEHRERGLDPEADPQDPQD